MGFTTYLLMIDVISKQIELKILRNKWTSQTHGWRCMGLCRSASHVRNWRHRGWQVLLSAHLNSFARSDWNG